MTTEGELLSDLAEAERTSTLNKDCSACDAISSVSDGARDALERALAGTIGNDRLNKILARNGFSVSRRTIIRHRNERHSS